MKKMNLSQKCLAVLVTLFVMMGTMIAPAKAYPYNYGNYGYCGSFFQCHPYLTHAAVGAGIGGVAGGLIGHDGGGIARGALIGGAAGTGYAYLQQHVFSHRYW